MGRVGGVRKGIRASAAPVTKALLSVADMVDKGHVVIFSKKLSFAYHPQDKQYVDFVRRNTVFEFDMEVDPPPKGGGPSGFARQTQP